MTSLSQPAMAAMLPVEIIQSIFLQMDVETYIAARLTCTAWRNATSTSLMTYKTVQKAPVALPPTFRELDEQAWGTYLDQIERINLLGFRNHVERTVTCRGRHTCTAAATTRLEYPGRKNVGVKGSRAVVDENEIKNQLLQFPLASSLYPLWTSVCRALSDGCSDGWMAKHQPNVQPQLAFSKDRQILAVGFGKRIQVYSALSEEQGVETAPVEYLIKDTTDGVIESLEFEDNGRLLRLAFDRQPNRVRYLGLPSLAPETPDLNYWRKCIDRIYLDSVELARQLSQSSTTRLVLAGLRLLPLPETGSIADGRGEDLRLFTACLQTGHVDCYCMGSVSLFSTAEMNAALSITIHQLLPSRQFQPYTAKSDSSAQLSNVPTYALPQTTLRTTLNPDSTLEYDHYPHRKDYQLTHIPRWDQINLPLATVDTPQLAISEDSRMLVVYEPCALQRSQGGSLYVYNVEPCEPVYEPFPRPEQRQVDWSLFGQVLGGLGLCFVFDAGFDMIKSKMADAIPSWPFLLDKVDVDINELKISCESSVGRDCSYIVSAQSSEGDIEWRLNHS